MHPETKEVSKHMKEFGSHILSRAVYDAIFSEINRPFAHALSVVHAAHGTEILIKARIAEEHPLLIFKSYPKSKDTKEMLSLNELFTDGQTLMYSDLPEALWATTGYRIKSEPLKKYKDFGRLRNTIVHFAAPSINCAIETLKFAFEVIDPIIQDFWGESFITYLQQRDKVLITDKHLQQNLERLEIQLHPETEKFLKSF